MEIYMEFLCSPGTNVKGVNTFEVDLTSASFGNFCLVYTNFVNKTVKGLYPNPSGDLPSPFKTLSPPMWLGHAYRMRGTVSHAGSMISMGIRVHSPRPTIDMYSLPSLLLTLTRTSVYQRVSHCRVIAPIDVRPAKLILHPHHCLPRCRPAEIKLHPNAW